MSYVCRVRNASFMLFSEDADQNLPEIRLLPVAPNAKPRLFALDRAGCNVRLQWTNDNGAYAFSTIAPETFLVGGTTEHGWFAIRGKGICGGRLLFGRTTVVGNCKPSLNGRADYQIAPTLTDGRLTVCARWHGEPLSGAEVQVAGPMGLQERISISDWHGVANARFEQPGTYHVWSFHHDPTPGTINGRGYRTVWYYSALAMDFYPSAASVPISCFERSRRLLQFGPSEGFLAR